MSHDARTVDTKRCESSMMAQNGEFETETVLFAGN